MSNVDIRRERLREWFTDKKIPKEEKSYLSQLMTGKASFGEKAARRLEKTYGIPEFFLDGIAKEKNPVEVNDGLPTSVVAEFREKKITLTKELVELIETFSSLPEAEAKRFLAEMKARKAHFDAIFEEMLKKRHGKAS